MQQVKNVSSDITSLIDPLIGIVKWAVEVPLERSDPEVFVVAAKTSNTAVLGFPTTAEINGSGAGLSARSAYAAAVGECVERYASCITHHEEWLYGSFKHLSELNYNLVRPENWALFHQQQWDHMVDTPFTCDTNIAWVKADNLSTQKEIWIPACLVYMSARKQFLENGCARIGPAISTGTACANTRAEATLKGIYEVIERDAFIIMWRNQLSLPRVVITAESPFYGTFKKVFARPGLEYNLFYTTLDLGIPSFFGYLKDLRRNPPSIVVGGAAHSNPQTAILKTLLELVQGLKWIDHLEKKAVNVEPEFSNIQSFDERVHLYAFGNMQSCFNFLESSTATISLHNIENVDKGDIKSNLENCLKVFDHHGLDVIGIDLTTVDVFSCGLHVIKVLVPGCEQIEGDHRYRFLGGERWRKLPVELGMRSKKTTIDSLNPYPHPYP